MAPISTVNSSSMSDNWSELPIRQRGLFLNDHFFRDSREHFQQALDKVLHDWEDQEQSDNWHSSKLSNWDEDIFSDRLRRYRMLRNDHKQNDLQAVTELNEEHQYKIIIDVREFMQGCLKTSIVGERELLVEGSIEETTFGVKGKRTFEKRFMLPSEAILNETTSLMSSDGILTIISPKKTIEKSIKENNEAMSDNQSKQNKRTALNQKHSMFSDDFIDEFLPISRRGHFFSDSSFKDAHEDFNKAVRDVLERWNETSDDDFTSYRNLRRRTLKEDNQAVTEKENHQVYKIVIDVHDFVTDGEVSVKVVNDSYLEVEGCIDKDEEENKCKKTFKRRFTLPRNTDVKNISSLLSADGVLTITSPKKDGQIDFKETIIPVKLGNYLKKESSGSTLEPEANNSSVKNLNESYSIAENEIIAETKSNTELEMSKEIKKNINNEFIIPVTLEENNDDMEQRDRKHEQTSASMESAAIKDNIKVREMKDQIININYGKMLSDINEEGASSNDTDSELSEAASETSRISSQFHNITQNKGSVQLDNATSLQEDANAISSSHHASQSEAKIHLHNNSLHQEHSNVNSSSHKVLGKEYRIPVNIEVEDEVLENDSNVNSEMEAEEQIYKQNKDTVSNDENINVEHEKALFSKIPIVRRGPFFVDSFFTESQKQFEKAVQNILQQSGFTSRDNDLEFYRSLRQRSNSEQNQANGCTEDETSFKIVVDVQDFKSGDIKIKVHNANELTVEGEQNQNQNYSLLKRKFCRKFIFPCAINCDAVTSAVSEEGVLTINAPKKIKECCEKAKSDVSVKSILISHDSNDGIKSSNKKVCINENKKDDANGDFNSSNKGCTIENKKEAICISDNQNNETMKNADNSICDVEEEQICPITRRGSFFTDPFFEDSRLILGNTIRDIIDKSGFISKNDDFSFYRSMLERSTNKEKQVATITENDNIYKIVVDIQGFSANEIKTKFLSSTDLVIEAATEKREEGSSSTRHFRRCFVFPNSVNIESVTTSLSSDGILTISAPKKVLEDDKERSFSKDLRRHINLNNGWEDEKTHQASSERDGVISKTFSKSKSSYQHFTNAL